MNTSNPPGARAQGPADALAEPRVQVLALVRPLELPRLVVDDSCAEPGMLDVEAEEYGEVVRGPVDAVAEPERRDVRRTVSAHQMFIAIGFV